MLDVYGFAPVARVVYGWRLLSLRDGGSVEVGDVVIEKNEGALWVVLPGDGRAVVETVDDVDERLVYKLVLDRGAGVLVPVEYRGPEGYMRLHVAEPGMAPTVMINGVVMHRVSGVDPLSDAWAKARAARIRRGSRVLDVCTGLGYTALAALRRGAGRVYSVEVSRAVLLLAEHNPESRELASDNVVIVNGDALDVVPRLKDEYFTNIIHDPPRFSLAGELYSLEFYRELYRVLRRRGVLFHYTGEPMRSRGRGHGPVVRGVMERLERAGFRVLGFDERAMGVVAVKP